MSSISGVLQHEGDDLYPYTFDAQVLDSNNVPLNQRLGAASEASSVSGSTAFSKINTLNTNIGSVSSDLGSKSSASAVTGNDAFSKINTLNSQLTNLNGMQISDTDLASYLGKTYTIVGYLFSPPFVNGLGYLCMERTRFPDFLCRHDLKFTVTSTDGNIYTYSAWPTGTEDLAKYYVGSGLNNPWAPGNAVRMSLVNALPIFCIANTDGTYSIAGTITRI